jgi:hypothetical protein
MSRILRRPMFRGGSPNNGGIMSYAQPRKGYAGDYGSFVQQNSEDSTMSEEESGYANEKNLNINGPQMKKESSNIQQQNKTYKAFGQNVEEGSIGDVMLKEYLGNRPDPMGKFLINFGLNYMSARPKGGKFGALATAAESAKKPTEQLYADIDTDRLLKLKLMGALSKSESSVADVKRAKAAAETRDAPNSPYKGLSYDEAYQRAYQDILKGSLEKKKLSTDEKIAAQQKSFESKSLTSGSEFINKNKAEIFVRDIEKLGKNIEKVDANNPWIENVKLTPKANSTDVEISGATENVLKRYSTGNIYINPTNRMSYEYLGKNIFRPVTKL